MDVDVREGSGGSGSNHHQGASSTQQLVTPPPIVATAGNLNNAPSHPQGNNPLQDVVLETEKIPKMQDLRLHMPTRAFWPRLHSHFLTPALHAGSQNIRNTPSF